MIGDCNARRAGVAPQAISVLDINGQAVSMFAGDPEFAAALEAGDIIHADGQFIIWLSRLFAPQAVPERTATTDLIHAAAAAAAEAGLSFYLLGATEEVNAAAAARLAELYPGLQIVGRRNGFFAPEEEDAVIKAINKSGADILWVGLGKPKEQLFAMRRKADLACGWLVTCGGCFNFLTGAYSRAPVWMQKAGFEWLHRAATGPSYLLGRYAITIPHAIWLAIRYHVLGRDRQSG
jgi:exopolysaccharide biosynthesis WecB/TagA/CpsF family protein